MDRWELEDIIYKLNVKLDYLTQKKENNHYQAYGTDVKYEYGERTNGTKEEIAAVREQIAKYQQALDKKIAEEKKQESESVSHTSAIDADRQKREEERAKKKEAESRRLETFKQVKDTYKTRKGHGFRKFADHVFGNGPKWQQVKKYTQEELDFALKSLSGETIVRKKRNEKIKALTEKERAKKVKNGNWDNFTAILNSRLKLKQQMEVESVGHRL